MALEDKAPWQPVELTEWPRVYGNSSGNPFTVHSPALDSQQVVSVQLLIRAGRADGLSLAAWEFLLCRERQTLVLTPCCGLFSFQSITSDIADKEPVCQWCPRRGESSSLPVLLPGLSARAFSDYAGHQVRKNSAGSRITASQPCQALSHTSLLATS